MARARQIQTRITMLGIGYPEDRYATLQKALHERVHNDGLDLTAMSHDDLTPGEVANARGMHAKALEIFLGLVYLDYTDDPEKEAHGH